MSCLKCQLLQTSLWWRQYSTPYSRESCLLLTMRIGMCAAELCLCCHACIQCTTNCLHTLLMVLLSWEYFAFAPQSRSCPFSSSSSYNPSIIALRKAFCPLTWAVNKAWKRAVSIPVPHKWSCSTGRASGKQQVHTCCALRSGPPGCPQDLFLCQKQRGLGTTLQQLCSVSRPWLGNISASTIFNTARNMGAFMINVKAQHRLLSQEAMAISYLLHPKRHSSIPFLHQKIFLSLFSWLFQ